jgi:non-heme chloroperoxidase
MLFFMPHTSAHHAEHAAFVHGLEILFHRSHAPSTAPPLLFVHGACAGAWCWEEHYLPYFAHHGYNAYALSLRGHGHSAGRRDINSFSLKDYLDDITNVAAAIHTAQGQAPVLIGHSMGGLLVQQYMERSAEFFPVTAAVLMASFPASRISGSWWYWQMQSPLLWLSMQQFMRQHYRPASAFTHTWVFSASAPRHLVDANSRRFIMESSTAAWDMLTAQPNIQAVRRRTTPLLVMGAENDAIFPAFEVRNTASLYNAPCKILPKMAHGMMLEENWLDAASYLRSWLDKVRQSTTTPHNGSTSRPDKPYSTHLHAFRAV